MEVIIIGSCRQMKIGQRECVKRKQTSHSASVLHKSKRSVEKKLRQEQGTTEMNSDDSSKG